MKLLTQDKKLLIETDCIYVVYNYSLYARLNTTINKETIKIAEYREIPLETKKYHVSIESGCSEYIEKSEIKTEDICKIVLKDMVSFFNKYPDSIYELPTQEEIEKILKGNKI